MWTEVFVTNSFEDMLLLKENLIRQDMLVRIKKSSEADSEFYTVLVPYSEVNTALNTIIDLNL